MIDMEVSLMIRRAVYVAMLLAASLPRHRLGQTAIFGGNFCPRPIRPACGPGGSG